MRRREFITLLGSGIAGWPHVARAQQSERMRHIGALISISEKDPDVPPRLVALRDGLQKFGWIEGGNVRFDYRFGAGDSARIQTYAAELVAAKPDLLFASGTPTVSALQRATDSIPVVFVVVEDPVGSGLSRALRIRAATLRASAISNTRLAENG
jgi:putative tryptophan/tyrosine transport system substrate-binding protein